MNENSNPTQEDFQAALATEFGLDPVAEEITPPEPALVAPVEAEPVAEPAAAEVEVSDEPLKPQAGEAAITSPNEPEAPVVEEPKFATKDDVIDAMREYTAETTSQVDRLDKAKNEIIDLLHPEGIDRKIYDTNNQVINTAQDIVDRGLSKANGELFTYDEAASFMLQSQQKMNENIEELNSWAEGMAEKNIDLLNGNERVMLKWGDTLKTLPEATVKLLADTYIGKQIKFDKTNTYITDMAMSPEDFYNIALAPYSQLNAAIAEKTAMEAKMEAQVAAQKVVDDGNEQDERNGMLPQRGQSAVKSNTGNAFTDAFIDEMSKN